MRSLAYLHGFASSPLARKGQALRLELAQRGVLLHLPDLNRPSLAEIKVTDALVAIDELVDSAGSVQRWSFIGSSFGGYLAARWAELHPDRVHRMILLCPGFDLASRWRELVGEQGMARWQREGALEIEDATGRPVDLHWPFYEDFLGHPAFPRATCPTLVIHGRQDEVVPVSTSRLWAETSPEVELLEVDDDHGLHSSLPLIAEHVGRFLIGLEL